MVIHWLTQFLKFQLIDLRNNLLKNMFFQGGVKIHPPSGDKGLKTPLENSDAASVWDRPLIKENCLDPHYYGLSLRPAIDGTVTVDVLAPAKYGCLQGGTKRMDSPILKFSDYNFTPIASNWWNELFVMNSSLKRGTIWLCRSISTEGTHLNIFLVRS